MLRGDCLEHVLIFGERRLRRVLALYALYYNETRTGDVLLSTWQLNPGRAEVMMNFESGLPLFRR
jgi:hypothetical protein